MISQPIVRSMKTQVGAGAPEGSPVAILSSLLGSLADHRSQCLMGIPLAAPRSRSLFEHVIEVIESSERLFLAELCQAMTEQEREDPRRRAIQSVGNVMERLSERELQVAYLVANGLKNKEIAKKLIITENTVQSHIAKIFSKLNVTNRTELGHKLDLLDRERGVNVLDMTESLDPRRAP